MSEADAGTVAKVAGILGFKDEDLVQELGYDDDVDFLLRESIEDLIGSQMFDEADHDVVDAVILWWRKEDGDLVDTLVDSLTSLDEGGAVWILTPKSGRDGHVSPAELQEAAPTAGLHVTTTSGVSADWAATRLVPRKRQ